MFSQPLPAACSDRQMTAVTGLTSAATSSPLVETFGPWPWIAETTPLPERLAAECFGASNPLSPCESFEAQGLVQHLRHGLKSIHVMRLLGCDRLLQRKHVCDLIKTR